MARQILEGNSRNRSFSFSVSGFQMKCLEECGRYTAISMELEDKALENVCRRVAWKFSSEGFLLCNFFFCLYIMCRNITIIVVFSPVPAPRGADEHGCAVGPGWVCDGSHGPRVRAGLPPGLTRSRVWETELSVVQCLCRLNQRKQTQ